MDSFLFPSEHQQPRPQPSLYDPKYYGSLSNIILGVCESQYSDHKIIDRRALRWRVWEHLCLMSDVSANEHWKATPVELMPAVGHVYYRYYVKMFRDACRVRHLKKYWFTEEKRLNPFTQELERYATITDSEQMNEHEALLVLFDDAARHGHDWKALRRKVERIAKQFPSVNVEMWMDRYRKVAGL